jgi:arylsulfatase A-like enzyme
LLINPSLSPQRSFDRLASHIDLAPTIVDLIGLPARGEWDGSSLFRPHRESPVMFATPYIDLQVGYRLGDRKVVARLLDGRASVYDLAVDPQERRDLAAGNPDMQERELARIRSWVRHLNTRGAD